MGTLFNRFRGEISGGSCFLTAKVEMKQTHTRILKEKEHFTGDFYLFFLLFFEDVMQIKYANSLVFSSKNAV